MLVEL